MQNPKELGDGLGNIARIHLVLLSIGFVDQGKIEVLFIEQFKRINPTGVIIGDQQRPFQPSFLIRVHATTERWQARQFTVGASDRDCAGNGAAIEMHHARFGAAQQIGAQQGQHLNPMRVRRLHEIIGLRQIDRPILAAVVCAVKLEAHPLYARRLQIGEHRVNKRLIHPARKCWIRVPLIRRIAHDHAPPFGVVG